eukprot:TRINITY_DN11115_c0_g2_i3.p2 TRINITY_DN11115_c0_g2~~TRINITY_DN11115_c0_g2_i3.p2  ORF type:complete len:137 (+),score=9.27 TRINITY_DN11115_c0_g2_i3:1539-1949(+)
MSLAAHASRKPSSTMISSWYTRLRKVNARRLSLLMIQPAKVRLARVCFLLSTACESRFARHREYLYRLHMTTGPFLFNLTSDPTESDDLSTSQPRELEAMMQKLNVYEASLQVSQYQECGCLAHQGLSEGAASFRI